MLDTKGILISRHGRRAVLLTKDGGFQSVRLRRSADVSIGQTVSNKHLSHSYLIGRYLAGPAITVGLSLLLLLPLSHSSYNPEPPAVAYITIDLAPSIEASIDRDYNVLSVRPLNADARSVIDEPHVYRGLPLDEFSSRLFTKLYQMNYLDRGSLCVITTALTNRVSSAQRGWFDAGIDRRLAEGMTALLTSGIPRERLHSTMAERAAAEEHRISSGRYLLYLRANAYGQTLTLEEARRLPTARIGYSVPPASASWDELINKLIDDRKAAPWKEKSSVGGQDRVQLFRNPIRSVDETDRDKADVTSLLSRDGSMDLIFSEPMCG